MIRNGFTCRHIMVQSVYILNILTEQYFGTVRKLNKNARAEYLHVF